MQLKRKLDRQEFIVTSEVQTPLQENRDELIRHLNAFKNEVHPSAKEPDGIVGDTIDTCQTIEQNNLSAIYQTAIRGKNRLQIQSDLITAATTGISNLLVFTEDYRITGDSLQEMMFFHVDSGKLRSVLDHLHQGLTVGGHVLDAPQDFVVGCGVESIWGKNIPDLEVKEMEEMVKLGINYFLTTPVFNLERFEKFAKQVIPFKVPIIAELMVLGSAEMGKFLNRHLKSGLVPGWLIQKLSKASDKAQARMEIFEDLVKGLTELCQGIHIITIGAEDGIAPYLAAASALTATGDR